MDFLNKAKGMMGGQHGQSSNTAANPQGDKPDYVDKGLAAVQKKMGMSSNAQTNERITDSGREYFEKTTGKKIPHNVSN